MVIQEEERRIIAREIESRYVVAKKMPFWKRALLIIPVIVIVVAWLCVGQVLVWATGEGDSWDNPFG